MDVELQSRQVLADLFETSVEDITADKRLKEDLNASELDFVYAAMWLEEEFEIDILDEDIDGAKTVGDYIAAVQKTFARQEKGT